MAPIGLYARLCHAFLVITESTHRQTDRQIETQRHRETQRERVDCA